MRRALHLLIAFAVLLCGLHIMEPAGSSSLIETVHAAPMTGSEPGDRHDSGDASDKLAHSGHHHCPVAPALRLTGACEASPLSAALVFACPAEALPSLAHAPPLQPPNA